MVDPQELFLFYLYVFQSGYFPRSKIYATPCKCKRSRTKRSPLANTNVSFKYLPNYPHVADYTNRRHPDSGHIMLRLQAQTVLAEKMSAVWLLLIALFTIELKKEIWSFTYFVLISIFVFLLTLNIQCKYFLNYRTS